MHRPLPTFPAICSESDDSTFLVMIFMDSLLPFKKCVFTNLNQPFFLYTTLEAPQTGLDLDLLWKDSAKQLLMSPNGGGSSHCSEALSFVFLKNLLGDDSCMLTATESQIQYRYPCKKTDYSVTVEQDEGNTAASKVHLGVSVSRACSYYSNLNARELLRKKLLSIIESSEGVSPKQRWSRQILHIWVNSRHLSQILKREWNQVDASLRSNTIVLVTNVGEEADFIF